MVVSDWEGELACFDWEGVRVDIPNALARLSVNQNARNYDLSGVGPGDDVIGETRSLLRRELKNDVICTNQISLGEDRVRSVQNLSLAEFRRLRIQRSRRRIAENAN